MILTACFLLFVCALGIYTYTLVYPKAKQSTSHQPEQPEQSTTEYERPNVFYSKDIQIVSEPNYLTPPYSYRNIQRMIAVECLQNNTVLCSFLLCGSLVVIQIKDENVFNIIKSVEAELLESPPISKHRTKPVDVVTDYLFGVKIFKH